MFELLAVDPDDQFLELFCQHASRWPGVRITTAPGAREAEGLLRSHPCDAIVSEYLLGETDGLDLLRYVRARHGEIPFILLTAYGSERVAAEASRFGISGYIIKGSDPIPLFSEVYGKIREGMRRKEAAESLKEREARCRTILESQPGFICRFGPDLAITFVNRSFARLAAASEELVGSDFAAQIVPEDREAFRAAIGELAPACHSTTLDLRMIAPGPPPGGVRHTAWTFTAVFEKGERPSLIHGSGRDVTRERELGAAQVRRLENLAFLSRTAMAFVDMEDTDEIFQFVVEMVHAIQPHSCVAIGIHHPAENNFTIKGLAGDAETLSALRSILGFDLKGLTLPLDRVTYMKVAFTMKGLNESAPLYHVFLEMYPEEVCRRIEEACDFGKIYTMGLFGKDGVFGHLIFAVRGSDPIANRELLEAFVNQATVALLRYLARREAEEEIARTHAELERRVTERTSELQEANKSLEAFSGSVSHDLRTPLRSIDGFLGILAATHGREISPKGMELILKSRQNVGRMTEMIDAMLEFFRATGKELNRKEVDIRAMAGELVSELTGAEGDRRMEVKIGELPPCRADPVLLRQALQNLLSNAIKFSRNARSPCIEIGAKTDGGETVYYVRDNGIGFDMQQEDRLFRVFERLHEKEGYEGTGIGLAIAYQILRNHGGRCWAESEPKKGATFYFTLGGKGRERPSER